MKTTFLGLLFLLFITETSAQWPSLNSMDITGEVSEVSGMICLESGQIFVIGDSGNQPKVYELNPATGEVLHEIFISGAKNVDWEELQLDSEGNLYIGDIGNNLGQRQNLTIYKIEEFSASCSLDTISTFEQINFQYADQSSFKQNPLTPFDAEAFYVLDNNIFLISKNRGAPGETKTYSFPNEPGKHWTEPTSEILNFPEWITGCVVQNKTIYLCSDSDVFKHEMSSSHQIGESICSSQIPSEQAESVCLNPYGQLLVTDDIETGAASRLIKLIDNCNENEIEILLAPNPVSEYLIIDFNCPFDLLEIVNSKGELVKKIRFSDWRKRVELDVKDLAQGLYTLVLRCNAETHTSKFMKY